MKKFAYLIIANDKFKQLQFLISLLDSEDTDIYLMIDKKSPISSDMIQVLDSIPSKSVLFHIPSIDIRWGGYSQIKAEMKLFEAASRKDYKYYHLISGSDLPIENIKKINSFFDKEQGKCFLSLVDEKIKIKNKIEERIRYYHLFNERMLRGNKNLTLGKLLFKLDKISVKLQKFLHIDLIKKYDIKKVGYASNWVSLDHETVQLLIKNKAWVHKVFKYSFCSDEILIPTFLYQFGYDNKIYSKEPLHDKKDDIQGNLRYINWWDGSPYTWKDGDEEKLDYAVKLGHFWSRKFDLKNSPNLKQYILKKNSNRGIGNENID